MEIDVIEALDGGISEWYLLPENGVRVGYHRELLFVLVELSGHLVDLGTQLGVLVVGGLRCLCKLLDLGFQVLQMLLLSLSESPLSGSVLRLALLNFAALAKYTRRCVQARGDIDVQNWAQM